MFRVAVVTLSDSGYAGKREDVSGPTIVKIMKDAGYEIASTHLLPDNQKLIEDKLVDLCDADKVHLILTTGGTGFAPTDCTPEATINVCHRLAPGIPEAMRSLSMEITSRSMLTRAVAGIRGETLIINMPGSPKAVTQCLEFILSSLEHGLEILTGKASNCGGK